MNVNSALREYQSVRVQSAVSDASAHKVVSLLMEGVLDRLSVAKGHIERGNTGEKGEQISRVIAVIDTLRASLNHEQGGDIAANLAALYDYMEKRLLEANLASNTALLDEVMGLMREIHLGWNAIPASMRGN